MNIASVILAAGFGTRMKSALPKVLHPVVGRPMLEWAVAAGAEVATMPPVVVVGHARAAVMQQIGDVVDYTVQDEQLGTGHAVLQAQKLLAGRADAVIVTYGDMPLLRPRTLSHLVNLYQSAVTEGNLALAMLTIVRADPQGFGRIVRDEEQQIRAIVEEADCTPAQRAITELNPGVYCFQANWLWENLPRIPVSAKGEYYLTDLIAMAVDQGKRVVAVQAPVEDVQGINTRLHLAEATEIMQRRIVDAHMLNGVTIVDPRAVVIEHGVAIGQDTTILPGTLLQGRTTIGQGACIGPNSQIVNSQIGDNCRVTYSVVEDAQMDENCEIGPFGHLRKGAHLAAGVHMGNFGEVKNSYLASGVKMGHFSYLGDAHVEENVNIGAGTITCNYDGVAKHKTHIGQGAFIGSDTMLVAPVTIGAGANTGAGSVVTRDVAPASLVYGIPAHDHSEQKPAEE